jgi:hypothetical protein
MIEKDTGKRIHKNKDERLEKSTDKSSSKNPSCLLLIRSTVCLHVAARCDHPSPHAERKHASVENGGARAHGRIIE